MTVVRDALAAAPTVSFTVAGMPGAQGSKRHVGRGLMVESSRKVAPWREDVKHAAQEEILRANLSRIEGPVAVAVTVYFDRPKSHPKRTMTWPTGRNLGDVEKLCRSTFDALTASGLIRDDSQIIEVWAVKRWTVTDSLSLGRHTPGADIELTEIAGGGLWLRAGRCPV